MPTPTSAARPAHLDWLKQITALPTAAGREWRVSDWIKRWVAERPALHLADDAAGNLVVSFKDAPDADGAEPPLYITAHLDHPAFVVERILGPGTVELSFRGGVMDVFFENAPVIVHTRGGARLRATLGGTNGLGLGSPFKHYLAELHESADDVAVGDVATWDTPGAEVIDGILHTPACDDLAAVAAAIATMDILADLAAASGEEGGEGEGVTHTRLLFTRAEEIGFVGAIAACKLRTMPMNSRVIALENSRAFDDSPIGGGPIVRVGDRMSIFEPRLTAACAKRAEEVFARPAQPIASQTAADISKGVARPWQRKLMAGGACEASVFCGYGYQATCLCLPLGNYHNMPHLPELQAGTYDRDLYGPPRCAREFISVADFHGLVDLLVALAQKLPITEAGTDRFERLYAERKFVLE